MGLTGVGAGVAVVAAALPPKILNMTVPQVGHLPLMALRPFFIVSSTALEISFLALHLTQYPSGIIKFPPRAPCARRLWEIPYERVVESVNLYSGQTRKHPAAIRDWPG